MNRSYEQLFREVEHVGSWWVRDGSSEYDVAGLGGGTVGGAHGHDGSWSRISSGLARPLWLATARAR
jgi:hypothetical protein